MCATQLWHLQNDSLKVTLDEYGCLKSVRLGDEIEFVGPTDTAVVGDWFAFQLGSRQFPTKWSHAAITISETRQLFTSCYQWNVNPRIAIEKRVTLLPDAARLNMTLDVTNTGPNAARLQPWVFNRWQIAKTLLVYVPTADSLQELRYGDYDTPTGYNYYSIPSEPWLVCRMPDRGVGAWIHLTADIPLNAFYTADGRTIRTGRDTPVIEWHYAPIELLPGGSVSVSATLEILSDQGTDRLISAVRDWHALQPPIHLTDSRSAGPTDTYELAGVPVQGTPIQPDATYVALEREPVLWDRPSVSLPNHGRCWLAHSLEKVGPHDRVRSDDESLPTVELDLARGESESFQLVIEHVENGHAKLHWHLEPWRRAVDADTSGGCPGASDLYLPLRVYRVGYVRARRPSDLLKGTVGWLPDPLFPLPYQVDQGAAHGQVDPDDIQGPERANTILWYTVMAPSDIEPGLYTSYLTVSGVQIPMRLRIRSFSLPAVPTLATSFGVWEQQIERYYGVNPGQPEWERLVEAARELLLQRRISFRGMSEIHWDDLPKVKAKIRQYFGQGLTSLDIPTPFTPKAGGGVLKDDSLGLWRHRTLCTWLRQEGLLSRAFVYIGDEPAKSAFESIRQAAMTLRDETPDLRVLLTIDPHPDLMDAIDIFSPIFDGLEIDQLRWAQEQGKEVWWYPCVGPKHPYPNFLSDYENVDWRVIFWMSFFLGVDGLLYWTVNYWEHRVWDDAESYPGGNGDGLLIYPAVDGPVPSVRLEVIRDGMEDYECLVMARDLAADPELSDTLRSEAEDLLDQEMCGNPTQYERDAHYWIERRRKLMDWLDRAWQAVRTSDSDAT